MQTWKGFTLVELMITIAVASILLGVGIPSLQQFLETNRRAAAVNLLITSLQQARSTATARGARVIVCQASNQAGCDATGSTEDWSVGWLSFVDSNSNGSFEAGTDELLQYTQSQTSISMPANTLSFGYSPGFRGLSPAAGGTIAVCPTDDNTDGRWIVVSATGRPRLSESLPAGAPEC